MNILEQLTSRTLLKNTTSDQTVLHLAAHDKVVYCGFDPTFSSLHIGHLVQLITLKWMARHGFQVIIVIGQATAIIGDPSGKTRERKSQNTTNIQSNAQQITEQITKIIPEAQFLNNATWLQSLSLTSFLQEVGKRFNLSYLLAKETIKNRIPTGLSFTEFTYNITQAYDFYYLYKKHNCHLQLGGSDQWGNITSGIELIKSYLGDQACPAGLTTNLLVKKDNTKFGKTSLGNIWLDPLLTSPYAMHQFLINQPDDEVYSLLVKLTMLPISKINELKSLAAAAPKARIMQQALSQQIITWVHGPEAYKTARHISQIFFTKQWAKLTLQDWDILSSIHPNYAVKLTSTPLKEILVKAKICNSVREIKELLLQNAIRINGELLNNYQAPLNTISPIHNQYYLIQKGKKHYFIIKLQA